MTEPLYKSFGYFCVKCNSLCHPYEQGLCCDCDQPWNTERVRESEYPPEWIRREIEVRIASLVVTDSPSPS